MAEDGFELVADGTVVFQLSEKSTIKLRRPSLGEYRKLVEQVEQMQEDAAAIITSKNGALTVDKLSDLLLEWVRLAVSLLGSPEELPPEDELPAWILNADLTRDLVAHWQKVPSRRGVR